MVTKKLKELMNNKIEDNRGGSRSDKRYIADEIDEIQETLILLQRRFTRLKKQLIRHGLNTQKPAVEIKLDKCFACKKKITKNNDIFIFQGKAYHDYCSRSIPDRKKVR